MLTGYAFSQGIPTQRLIGENFLEVQSEKATHSAESKRDEHVISVSSKISPK